MLRMVDRFVNGESGSSEADDSIVVVVTNNEHFVMSM